MYLDSCVSRKLHMASHRARQFCCKSCDRICTDWGRHAMKSEVTIQKEARICKFSGDIIDLSSFMTRHACENVSHLARRKSNINESSGACREDCSKHHDSCGTQGLA